MNGNRNRLGHLVSVVGFVAFFIACCGVCACVFARAAAVTREAEIRNTAVQLCRNQAELCRAGEGWEEETTLLRFDSSLCPAEDGAFWVRVCRSEEEAGLGTAVIQAGSTDTDALCTLEVTVYLPEREAANGA